LFVITSHTQGADAPAKSPHFQTTHWSIVMTAYGHPGEPKAGPGKILPLAKVTGANFGLTFENQGLSAKAVLDRAATKP